MDEIFSSTGSGGDDSQDSGDLLYDISETLGWNETINFNTNTKWPSANTSLLSNNDNNIIIASFDNITFDELPISMTFTQANVISIVVYSILMFISAVGNITVFATIVKFRMKARLNRVNLFLLHLTIADLLVTFLMMPLEIGWAATVDWKAGDAVCRIMSFFRTFGLFLSGFLLVCISLDRYFAVLKPLTLPEANRRGRYMLYAAWIGSIICSSPQAWIFHVEKHPKHEWFEQCVTFGSFPSKTAELAYTLFGVVFMYSFPLAMIIFCYTCILYEIFKINNLQKNGDDLRRSNMGALGRAKIRTLKMTVVIVSTFFLCWTPYNIMLFWYMIDEKSALTVDQRVQKALFLFACTNSCFNPMVYGLFHIRRKKSPDSTRYHPNNCRLQRLEKPLYKVRVRWTPRQCLCAASSGSPMSSSSGHPMRSRPVYERNGAGTGRIHYVNGTNTNQRLEHAEIPRKKSGKHTSHRYIGTVSQQNQKRNGNTQYPNSRMNNNVNNYYCSGSLRLDQTILLETQLDTIPMLPNSSATPGGSQHRQFSRSSNATRKKYSAFEKERTSYSPPGNHETAFYSPLSGVKFFSEVADGEAVTSTTFVVSRL